MLILFFIAMFFSINLSYGMMEDFKNLDAPAGFIECSIKQAEACYEWYKEPRMRDVEILDMTLSVPDCSFAWGSVIQEEAKQLNPIQRGEYIQQRRAQLLKTYRSRPDAPAITSAAAIGITMGCIRSHFPLEPCLLVLSLYYLSGPGPGIRFENSVAEQGLIQEMVRVQSFGVNDDS